MTETEHPPPDPPEPPAPTVADAAEDETRVTPPPLEPGPRRLTRSRTDRVVAGVCGGLGEYLGVDPVLVRIGAVILVFAGGAGILLYGIGWLVIPEAASAEAVLAGTTSAPPGERTSGAVALGALFVVVGVFFLLDQAFPDVFSWRWMWPVALIVLGLIVLVRARR
jgi:phage shock protein C